MSITIKSPQKLQSRVILPASKSISNRALIIHALACGGKVDEGSLNNVLRNLSDCDDTFVMVRALTQMPEEIDIMAAGTAMRFLSAYLAVTDGVHVITGTERMKHRPIAILVDALRALGAQVEYVGEEGFPPLRITGGRHRGGRLELPGNVSSQYISALLMIGPMLSEGLQLALTGEVVSRPYIEMTLSIMREFGATASWLSDNELSVQPGGYRQTPYYVEADWSASSYWYEMMSLTSDPDATVTLPGLFRNTLQGDAAVREIFRELGVETTFFTEEDGTQAVRLTRIPCTGGRLEVDMVRCPDLAQTVVATCSMKDMEFETSGVQSLKIKETDRMAALRIELAKLGYVIKERDGSVLLWDGERCNAELSPAIDTYEDHRMAMAFAPCAMKFGSLRINDEHVVSKSYPRFWEDLASAGFEIVKE